MSTGTEHRHPSRHGVAGPAGDMAVEVTVDKQRLRSEIDPPNTLLDLLRERLDVTAPKKGCDHGGAAVSAASTDAPSQHEVSAVDI